VRRRTVGLLAVTLAAAGCCDAEPERPALRIAAAPGCPKGLLALGANPLPAGSRAALEKEPPRGEPQVVGAYLGSSGLGRARQVRHKCGQAVAARSVVVEVHRRAHDRGRNRSASLAQGTVVVGRFPGGWRVWDVLH
jgi:hypothetical protein